MTIQIRQSERTVFLAYAAPDQRLLVADTQNYPVQPLQRCTPTNRIFLGGFEE